MPRLAGRLRMLDALADPLTVEQPPETVGAVSGVPDGCRIELPISVRSAPAEWVAGMGDRSEDVSPYTLFEHRHRFAAWAAARAAQRGFTSVEKLMEALEGCGVVEFASRVGKRRVSEAEYDAEHARWCERIMGRLRRRGVRNVTFGRAAKLVAVYLKTMIVIGPDGSSPIAGVLHPPIDRILLRSLARDPEVPRPIRRDWARLNWTTLDKRGYSRLIRQLRGCVGEGGAMWHLERHWKPVE